MSTPMELLRFTDDELENIQPLLWSHMWSRSKQGCHFNLTLNVDHRLIINVPTLFDAYEEVPPRSAKDRVDALTRHT